LVKNKFFWVIFFVFLVLIFYFYTDENIEGLKEEKNRIVKLDISEERNKSGANFENHNHEIVQNKCSMKDNKCPWRFHALAIDNTGTRQHLPLRRHNKRKKIRDSFEKPDTDFEINAKPYKEISGRLDNAVDRANEVRALHDFLKKRVRSRNAYAIADLYSTLAVKINADDAISEAQIWRHEIKSTNNSEFLMGHLQAYSSVARLSEDIIFLSKKLEEMRVQMEKLRDVSALIPNDLLFPYFALTEKFGDPNKISSAM